MATLLEIINNKNSGAGTGNPASASVRPSGTTGTGQNSLLDIINERKNRQQTLYSQAITPKEKKENLYSQAAQDLVSSGNQPGTNAAKGTGSVLASVYDKADDRESSLYSSAWADIMNRQDYAQNSQAGESRRRFLGGDNLYDYINDIGNYRRQVDVAEARGMGEGYGKYAFMTEDEIGVYNYIYATQGKKAAGKYLEYLEPELDKQWYSGASQNVRDMANQNAFTQAVASAATAAAQPARTITGLAATLQDALRTVQGKNINPYSGLRTASRMTQDIRGDVAGNIQEAAPGVKGQALSFAYQTVMSALDSAVGAYVGSGIGQSLGYTGDALKSATNVITSGLMSSEVAALSIAEAKEKGYSDAGALTLGLIRGGVEYASEAMGGEWVIRNIEANPLNFMKAMALNMIPEGVEEVMSDAMNGIINLGVDELFGTKESGIPKLMEQFGQDGWREKNPAIAAVFDLLGIKGNYPELATVLAILGEEALSFLGGALATVGSSGAQTYNIRMGINQTAQQLNTTPQGVVQLMEDYNTENPYALSIMAKQFNVQNETDLRKKAGTGKTAEEIIKDNLNTAEKNSQSGTDDRLIDISELFGLEKGNAPDDGRASIETLPDGRKYVKADRLVMLGNNPDAWAANIEEYINGKIRNGEDVPVITVDGDTLWLTEDTAGKAGFRNYVYDNEKRQSGHYLTDEEYYSKLNAEAHIDELAEASTMNDRNKKPVPDHGNLHEFAKDGWKYRTVYFLDYDGKYYRITLSTGKNGDVYTVYNVGEMKEAPFPNFSGSDTNNGRAGKETSSGKDNTRTGGQSQGEKTAMQIAMEEAMRKKGITDEQSYFGEQSGDAGERAGGKNRGNEGGTTALRMDAGDEGGQGRDRFQDLVREEVTPSELGVKRGSTTQTVQVLDESGFAEGTPEYNAAQKAREAGLEPVFVMGTIQIGEGKKAKQARGYIIGNRVILQVDGKYTAEQILDHELYHQEARRNPKLRSIMRKALADNLSETELKALVERYIQAYDGVYDFSGMSQEEIAEICEEELFADLYAGIDNQGRQELRDSARSGFAQAQTMERQNAEAEKEGTGPPEVNAAGRQHGAKKPPRFDAQANDIVFEEDNKPTITRTAAIQEEARAARDRAKGNNKNSPFVDGFENRLRNNQDHIEDVIVTPTNETKNASGNSVFRVQDNSFFEGTVQNDDSGLDINVGIDGLKDTAVYAFRTHNAIRLQALSGIKELLQNAKIIGTCNTEINTSGKLKGRNNPHRMFQYVFAVPFKIAGSNDRMIAVMRVDAMYNRSGENFHRFYNLNSIDIGAANNPSVSALAAAQGLNTAPAITVADMVANVNPDLVGNHVTVAQPGMFSVEVPGQDAAETSLTYDLSPEDEAYLESANRYSNEQLPGTREYEQRQEALRKAVEQVRRNHEAKKESRPKYTVREGVGKLFADQLDRLTETADRTGNNYDGVQETLMDALLEAESEEDLDRILVGKDSARFAYSPELTEKLWELRQLIEVNGEKKSAYNENKGARFENESARNENESAHMGAEVTRPIQSTERTASPEGTTRVKSADELRRELREAEQAYMDHTAAEDLDYDYEGQYQHIKDLRRQIEEEDARDPHPERGELGKDGLRKCKDADAAVEELMEIGGARLNNETGDYKMTLRMKNDGHILASVDRNGRREKSMTFGDVREAAEWAAGYVTGQSEGRTNAELDQHKSEEKPEPGMAEKLFGLVDPQEEATRQLENSAAEAATQTLRERIRRANDEILALNRLERTTGLTDQQKAHREDLQKTLEIMNNELTSRKSKAGEKKKTEKTKMTGNKPVQSVADARKTIMDQFSTPVGSRQEVGALIQTALDKIMNEGRLTEEHKQQLFDALIDAGVVPKQADPTLNEIREDLRGRRIYVNEQERSDLGNDWADLLKRAWGLEIFLTNNPADGRIDAVNAELADFWGEGMFPTDNALSDMLVNMIEKAERGKNTTQPLTDAIADDAEYMGVSTREIYGDMFRKMEETLRTFAQKAGLEVALKNKSATDMAAERKRWEDRAERQAQNRRESKIRERVMNGLRRLERLRGKAAPDVQAQVDEVLRDIDTRARGLTPYGIENLEALQRAYEEAAKAAGFVDDENPGNFIRNPYVEEKLAALSKKHLNEMDINDVIELGRTVSALETTIRNATQMIGDEFDATIQETSEAVRNEVESSRGAKPGFWQKWLMEEHLSPRRFLEMLGGWKQGGAMQKLSQSLENGQTRMLDFQRRAAQSFDPFLSKKENRKWLERASGKKATWETFGVVNGMSGEGATGQTIELTPMMKIALYLHSKNNDNLRHIQTGGLIIPNKALYQKGKLAEAYAQGEKVKMQPEAVRAIANTLTEQEKTFAAYLEKFFNETSKDAINEVSMQLDGFERAGVSHYFPIETSAAYRASDVAGEAREQTVEGIGSIANERVHASNPIVLSDATDVLMRQIDKVGKYYGYAIPIRNFQAVNNYVFHEEGNAFATSIKDIMNRKWGSGAEQYINKMLADLQSGGRRSDMMGSALAKLRGNLAGATLMFNPSVALSQAASYPGAAQVLGWDALAHGLAGKVDTKLMEKYTPLYWYRNQGNSTQELGDAIKEKGLEQKLPWALNWIQKMDSATIRRLWAAAEYRVSKDTGLKPGSRADVDAGTDEYYKRVAEVFNRAVYDTQPNYTNMERAQILRSDSDVTKFLTMYKTVPLQYYGMMVEASGRLQAAMKGGTEQEKAAARRYFANTYGGLLAANTVYVAIKAAFKGLRKKDDDYRDEDGNLTAGSVGKQLGKDLMDVYAGSIIGGAEALSAAQYLISGGRFNAPEMSSLGYVEDMVKGVRSIITGIESEDPRKAAGAIKDAAETLAMGMGVPVKNAETYITALLRWVAPDAVLEYENVFGGLERSDLSGMDAEAVATAANIILRNRTGQRLDRSVTDELARLYGEGYRDAVPTSIPSSFTYNDKTVEIEDRRAYSDTWAEIVGGSLEELLTSDDYVSADDAGRRGMIDKLYDYATVQARKGTDAEYDPASSSTYAWTVKADECVSAGISLTDTICAITTIGNMSADKDENGVSISGTKKAKVVDYIDSLDLTDEQKDTLYLTIGGYKESTLDDTPWHGGSVSTGRSSGRAGSSGRSGSSSGGRRRSGGGSGKRSAAASVKLPTGVSSSKPGSTRGFDISELFGGDTSPNRSEADASAELARIVDKYYDGDWLAAAFDTKAVRGRTSVDFEL